MHSLPSLSTDSLLLRALLPSDWAEILYLRGSEEMNTYIRRKRPASKADAMGFVQRIERDTAKDKIYYWVICSHANAKMMGSICLHNLSEDKTYAEIGYDLHPTQRGKGWMTEAMTAVLEFGKAIGVKKFEAYTHRENAPSLALLARFGFKLEQNLTDEGNPDNCILSLQSEDL